MRVYIVNDVYHQTRVENIEICKTLLEDKGYEVKITNSFPDEEAIIFYLNDNICEGDYTDDFPGLYQYIRQYPKAKIYLSTSSFYDELVNNDCITLLDSEETYIEDTICIDMIDIGINDIPFAGKTPIYPYNPAGLIPVPGTLSGASGFKSGEGKLLKVASLLGLI